MEKTPSESLKKPEVFSSVLLRLVEKLGWLLQKRLFFLIVSKSSKSSPELLGWKCGSHCAEISTC